MKREEYVSPKVEVIEFETDDIMTASGEINLDDPGNL